MAGPTGHATQTSLLLEYQKAHQCLHVTVVLKFDMWHEHAHNWPMTSWVHHMRHCGWALMTWCHVTNAYKQRIMFNLALTPWCMSAVFTILCHRMDACLFCIWHYFWFCEVMIFTMQLHEDFLYFKNSLLFHICVSQLLWQKWINYSYPHLIVPFRL